MMFISILFFIVIFKFILPALETETAKFALFNYSALGASPGKALEYLFVHPINSIKLLFVNHLQLEEFDWVKFKYYLVFGLSGGLLLIFRPLYLIILIPIITKKMYNDDPLRWTYETYYGIETASVLPLLVFLVISEFKNHKLRNITCIIVTIILMSMSFYCFQISKYPNQYSKFQFFKPSFYYQDHHSFQIHKLLQQIPDKASVSASPRLLPHLANREKIFYFNEIHDAEYICISLTGDTWPFSQEEYNTTIKKLLISKQWQAKWAVDNIIIFQKNTASLAYKYY